MSKPSGKTIHVNAEGEKWQVESEASVLGQAPSREEAVELARQLAREEGAEFVIVHSLDGQVETTISIGR